MLDDETSGLDVRVPADNDYLELPGDVRRELRIKRPALGAPNAAGSENDESSGNSSVREELVDDAAIVFARIQMGADLFGRRRISTIAESQ